MRLKVLSLTGCIQIQAAVDTDVKQSDCFMLKIKNTQLVWKEVNYSR